MPILGPPRNEPTGEGTPTSNDSGLEVIDLLADEALGKRHLHDRDAELQMNATIRLARCFVESPDAILQELVKATVTLCGADGAGISIQRQGGPAEGSYEWVAVAGHCAGFLKVTPPEYPSACTKCPEHDTPQIFRVKQPLLGMLGVDADVVTDAILLPWEFGAVRGMIWILAHGRSSAFDLGDCRMMQSLASFASRGFRQQLEQRLLMEQAELSAAIQMANHLAHQINNPLQALVNTLYLANEHNEGTKSKTLTQQAIGDVERLSALVRKLLALPLATRL